MDIWIGTNYGESPDRILVLGESWYGDFEPLVTYIPRWASGSLTDHMFSRLFNAASGHHTETATHAQRRAWWDSIAFYNFVPGTVGGSRDIRPSEAAFRAAQQPLAVVLEHVQPRGVWIIGKHQAAYSADIVRAFGAAYEISPHTASYGLKSSVLIGSWAALREKVGKHAAP